MNMTPFKAGLISLLLISALSLGVGFLVMKIYEPIPTSYSDSEICRAYKVWSNVEGTEVNGMENYFK